MMAESRMPAKTRAMKPLEKMPLIMIMKHFSGSPPTSARVSPRCLRKRWKTSPMTTAAPSEMVTQLIAMRREPFTSAGLSMDMKRTRMWGMPK